MGWIDVPIEQVSINGKRKRMTPPPESLANLEANKGRWSHTPPSPAGRKNAGLSIIEWRNQLAEYCKDEIENVLEDPKAPASKLIAAKEMLLAMNGDTSARRDVCDYTNGKPTQPNTNETDTTVRIIVEHVDERPLHQITEVAHRAITGGE